MDICTFLPYISTICGALFFKFVPMPSWMSTPFDGTGSVSVGTLIYLSTILAFHMIALTVPSCWALLCQFLAGTLAYGLAIVHLGDNAVWAALASAFLPLVLSSLTSS